MGWSVQLLVAVLPGEVNLFGASLVFDLELAVVNVFLAVVAVAVIGLLFLLEGDLRVQLGSKFLSSGIYR